jgi:esterase/lipase superfamily enzyme
VARRGGKTRMTRLEDSRRSESIRSRHVGRDVLCVRWGHYGTPVLLFPTAGGDAEESERFKMMVALRPLIEGGRVKVFSCDSVGGQALVKRRDFPPGHFPRMQCAFDRFVAEEFVPWIRADCRTPDIEVVTAGASIGAFNAVAALCRHPDLFSKAIGMSGTYDVAKWLDQADLDVDFYYSSPMHFLPRLPDSPQLAKLRQRFVLIATGEGDYEDPQQSFDLAHLLGSKGIPNRMDSWGTKYRHDWTTWRDMLPKYLAELA